MNDRSRPNPILLSIAAVERDTGLSKDTLRMWQRRYRFPQPERDALGERQYPFEQVEKLRLLKRLLDAGHRPGRVVPLGVEALESLARSTVDRRGAPPAAPAAQDLRPFLAALQAHDIDGLRRLLGQAQGRLGLGRFVIDVVAPLNTLVGDAWMRGQLEIFEEHLYTEAMTRVLREGIASVPPSAGADRPRVLLTTFPGEPHGLGLLMAEALLALDGARCLSLGVQTPIWDTVLAASAQPADIVALGFTGCMPPNQVVDGLAELRAKLPAAVAVWAGGSAPVLQRRPVAGVTVITALGGIADDLRRWREGVHPAGDRPRIHPDRSLPREP